MKRVTDIIRQSRQRAKDKLPHIYPKPQLLPDLPPLMGLPAKGGGTFLPKMKKDANGKWMWADGVKEMIDFDRYGKPRSPSTLPASGSTVPM